MALAIAAAILIGAAAPWVALFLYERVLKAMAYLEDLENSNGGMSVFPLLVARYALGIGRMVSFIVIVLAIPIYWFQTPQRDLRAMHAYLFSFGVMFFLRFIPLNRRMRALGISPEQRGRQPKIFR